MLRRVQIQLGLLLVTLLGVTLLTFGLMHTIPGGPFTALEASTGRHLPPAVAARLERAYGLDKPLWQQYAIYVLNLAKGDFGYSLVQNESVARLVGQSVRASATLGAIAIGVAFLIGVPLGITAAVRRNAWPDHVATTISILGVCVPSFVLGFILIIVFALYLRWLPVAGWGTWKHLVLPVVALSAEPIALFTRYTRASMLEVLGELYVTVAKSKGLSHGWVVYKHALKNALIPVITVFGLAVPSLLIGSFLIETIFAVPGTGRFFVISISQRDYPVIMGMAVLYALLVTVVNFLVDLAYLWLDPRIRYG